MHPPLLKLVAGIKLRGIKAVVTRMVKKGSTDVLFVRTMSIISTTTGRVAKKTLKQGKL
jgi:hypothetical protein